MTLVLVVAGLTLAASFLCSLFEAALYAITPSRIEAMRVAKAAGADRLVKLRGDIEEPIAAILTVNTIAHTVGSAWCGAMVGRLYADETGDGGTAVAIFAAVFTVLVLSVTEIVPKSVGVRYAPALAPWIVWPIQWMIWSVWPVVWAAKKAMAALTGGGTHGPSEEEVLGIAALAFKGGSVRQEEKRWVQNALRLDEVTAGELRTPRTVVETLPATTKVTDVVERPGEWRHSRVPITEEQNVDRIVGLVYRREVFDAALSEEGRDLVLEDLAQPIRFVPESMPAHELLSLFLDEHTHMVAVVDEYGGFEGVVTLEDVLECFLGREIVDEHDDVTDWQKEALRRSELRRARREQSPSPGAGSAAGKDA